MLVRFFFSMYSTAHHLFRLSSPFHAYILLLTIALYAWDLFSEVTLKEKGYIQCTNGQIQDDRVSFIRNIVDKKPSWDRDCLGIMTRVTTKHRIVQLGPFSFTLWSCHDGGVSSLWMIDLKLFICYMCCNDFRIKSRY